MLDHGIRYYSTRKLVFIMYQIVIVTLCLLVCTKSFIVPNETPTLLSIIYSNIPPVKLGADSRVGFGFRLGPHADFQTLIEIGPQENTRPIGPQDNSAAAKRRSPKTSKLNEEALKSVQSSRQSQHPQQAKPEVELGNVATTRKPGAKKNDRSLFGKIEFKKVPGIDDIEKNKKSKVATKLNTDATPTKFVIL